MKSTKEKATFTNMRQEFEHLVLSGSTKNEAIIMVFDKFFPPNNTKRRAFFRKYLIGS